MAKLKTIALTISSISAFSGAAYSHAATPNQIGMAMMRLNSSLLDSGQNNNSLLSGSLWAAMRKDFRMNEVNSELVRMHENKFAANSSYFDRTINRSKPYMFHIANEVKKRNMPAEIALLPFIESAYVTKAKSHVGASGLWQFMPATGRHYGLERTPLYDGRHDVYAATNAALNYLQYLHGLFGDWSLALAAYNWGEGNVGRAVNRARAQGLEPTYENLRMPSETRNYVPKLLAVRNIVNNPQAYGMNVSDISNKPYFKTVSVDQPIDTNAIIRLANISESEFSALNPAYNAPVFIPKANRKLLLPTAAADVFEKNYRKTDSKTLLSWDIYTPYNNTTLSSIAAETGMSVSELKRLNGLSSNTLSSGRSILVAKNSIGSSNTNFIDNDNTPDTYQSNMPVLAPIQIAANTIKHDSTAAVATPKASAPIDFVNRSEVITIANKAENQASVPPVNITLSMPSEPAKNSPAAAENTAPAPIQTASAAVTDFVASTKAAANTPAAKVPEPIVAQTQATEPAAAATPVTTEIAIKEALPLPTQSNAGAEEPDPLMALAEQSEMRLAAAESVKAAVAQSDSSAAHTARANRIAENRTKQQQRTETRLARANNTVPATQTVAAGMHRVTDGDTLFNISKRYNLSVADLITANNIRGNNIRKGQILNVTAATPANKSNSVRNVAYTVRRGDTLNTIASRFNVDVNDIRRWNQNTRSITPGQRLKLIGS